jgi:hypothetical protein
MVNHEGGADAEEYRLKYVADRVNTTATVWLGITLACAECHDHKYDPFTQQDFYALSAFFNNVPEVGLDGAGGNPVPSLSLPTPELSARLAKYRERIARLQVQAERQLERQPLASKPYDHVWLDDDLPVGAVVPVEDGVEPWHWSAAPSPVPFSGKRVVLQSTSLVSRQRLIGAHFPLRVGASDRLFVHVYLNPDDPPLALLVQFKVGESWSPAVLWGEDVIIPRWPTKVIRHEKLPQAGAWVRLEVDVQELGMGEGAWINGLTLDQFKGTAYWDTAGLHTRTPQFSPGPLADTYVAMKKAEQNLAAAIPSVMVMQEMATPRETFILRRSDHLRKAEPVAPGVPGILPALPSGKANRLALARWLVRSDSPLTARVTVNRLWEQLFSVGIVKTTEDFGTQGERPTHPELLDWLAVEFMARQWDIKAILRLLVTSATYRQTAVVSDEARQGDPENRLLARGPRFRLSAEAIRDNALAVSGLLDRRVGGPSVFPYQSPGLWETVNHSLITTARTYIPSKGSELHRRSLYTYWKRSLPHPSLTIFDAPTREVCVDRRLRTTTPLQALFLLNDPIYMECARALAERILNESGPDSMARLTYGFRLCTARMPLAEELSILRQVHDELLAHYSSNPVSAGQLVEAGDLTALRSGDVGESAAWIGICNLLLNLDETITKE